MSSPFTLHKRQRTPTKDGENDDSPRTHKRRRTFTNTQNTEESEYYSCSVDELHPIDESQSTLPMTPPMASPRKPRFTTFTPSPLAKKTVKRNLALFGPKTGASSTEAEHQHPQSPSQAKRTDGTNSQANTQIIPASISDDLMEASESQQSGAFLDYSSISSPGSVMARSLSSELARSEQEELEEVMLSEVPLDWSLKTDLKFMSTKSFEWSSTISSMNESIGITEFVRCTQNGVQEGKHGLSRCAIDFKKALQYFAHPAMPMPASIIQMCKSAMNLQAADMTAEQEDYCSLWTGLKSAWTESFRSLYFLVRSKTCPFFYFMHPSYTVIFLASGVAGCKKYTAMLTRSNKSLRQRLKEAGVSFRLPLCSFEADVDAAPVRGEFWNELVDLNKSNVRIQSSVKTRQVSPDEPESLLLFTGHLEVHGLFDFLLNSSWSGDDVPTLLSPIAFSNCTLKQAHIKSNMNLKVKSKDAVGKFHDTYCLELTGPILPTNFIQLCNVFKASQGGEFSCTVKVLKNTIGINYVAAEQKEGQVSPSSSPAKPLIEDNLSALDQLKEAPSLGKAVLKKVAFKGNKFAVTAQQLL